MEIISHRGYWQERAERNQAVAFHRSFDLGFGTETDVRDLGGQLVISHDMPTGNEMSLDALLTIMGGRNLPLAINIKADGLAAVVKAKLDQAGHTNWFVFDMAIPDMRSYLQQGVPTYTRLSEVEPVPAWIDQAKGVWLDGFDREWYSNADIEALLAQGLKVCIVSPELHGRPHEPLWGQLQGLSNAAGLTLCTDLPETAQHFFK